MALSYRDQNVRFLRPLWAVNIASYAVLGLIAAWAVRELINGSRFPVALAGCVGGAVAFAFRYRRQQAVKNAWDLASADAVARAMFGASLATGAKVAQPIATAGTAQVQLIYGNTERGLELLSRVDWSTLPPVLRCESVLAYALADILRGDYLAAYAKASTTPELAELPAWAPGARRIYANLEAFLDATAVLASGDAAALARARSPATKNRMLRGLSAWAVSKDARRRGDSAEARAQLALCRKELPFAYALGAARPDRAGVKEHVTASADNPYAAPAHEAVFEPVVTKPGAWKRRVAIIFGIWLFVMAVTALLLLHRGG